MDRTSSNHNLRTTDISQDNSINNNQTHNEKPSGIVSFEKQKQFTLPKTAFNNPQQAAKTYVNINCSILSDPQTPYKDGKFSEVRAKTEDVYNALLNFERSVFRYHNKYDETQKDDDLKKAWEEFKITRNVLSKPEDSSNDEAVYKEKYENFITLKHEKEIDKFEKDIEHMEKKKARTENKIIEKKIKLYDVNNNDEDISKIKKELNKLKDNLNTIDREIDAHNNFKDHKKKMGIRKETNLETYLADSSLSAKLDPLTGVFRDSKTGLYAELKPLGSTPGKYALCFGSTGVGRMTMKQIKVDIAQVLNKTKVPAAYEQAAKLAAELIKETGAEITVTGQSMGGGLANYVGMKLGIESVCYNPAALGQAAIKDLEKNRCLTLENLNKQKIIRQKGDIVSGEKNQKKIARLANFFTSEKVGIPQHLGPTFIANKTDNPLLNGVTRGYQSRHFTSSFQPFYDYSNTQTVQADTASEKSTISSESSSVGSPSGGE